MYGLEHIYRFLHPLGVGAEGTVHLVEDRSRGGLQVALKVLRQEVGAPREFRHLAQQQHPTLAAVYDCGTVDAPGTPEHGSVYFTTEFFPGRPLTELPAPFDARLFEGLLHEACRALAHLNQHGYRHGDLKPEHLLFRAQPEPSLRVIDLGYAARLDEQNPPHLGTPPYAAPEVWGTRTPPGRNTDLYALGMVALQTLRGSLPLRRATPQQWREWHSQGDRAQALAGCQVAVADELLDLVSALIEPHPADRPYDAAELMGMLQPLQTERAWEDVPLVGRHDVLAELERWLRRTLESPVLLLGGAAGIGKTRVVGGLERLARGRGWSTVRWDFGSIAEHPRDHLEQVLSRSFAVSDKRLLLVDDCTRDFPGGGRSFGQWLQQLRSHHGDFRLLLALAADTDPARIQQRLRSLGIIPEVLWLGPLTRSASDQLVTAATGRSGDSVPDLDLCWRAAAGSPRSILQHIDYLEPDAGEAPRASTRLEAVLDNLPCSIPLPVLLDGLGWTPTRFWTEVGGDPRVVVEGRSPNLRVRPLELEPPHSAPPLKNWVEPLARAWVASDDVESDWAPQLLQIGSATRNAQPPATSGSDALGVVQRLRDQQRWPALLAATRYLDGWPWSELHALARLGRDSRVAELWTQVASDALPLLAGNQPDASPGLALDVELLREVIASLERAGLRIAAWRLCGRVISTESLTGATLAEFSLTGVRLQLALGEWEGASEAIAELERQGLLQQAQQGSPGTQIQLAQLLITLGQFERAAQLFEQALQAARSAGATQGDALVRALSGLAGHERRQRNLQRARQLLRLACRYAQLIGRADQHRDVKANLAAVYYEERDLDRALHCFEEIRESFRREPDTRLIAHVTLGLGTVLRERAQFLEALRILQGGLREARQWAEAGTLAHLQNNIGELYLLLGDPQRSVVARKEAVRHARRMHHLEFVRQTRAGLGAALARAGRLTEAASLLDRAKEMAASGVRWDAMIDAFRGEVAWLSGDRKRAARAFGASLRAGLRSQRFQYTTQALIGLARLAEEGGDAPRATRLLQRARLLAERAPNPRPLRLQLQCEELAANYRQHGVHEGMHRALRGLLAQAERQQLREVCTVTTLLLTEDGAHVSETALRRARRFLRRLPAAARLLFARRWGLPESTATQHPMTHVAAPWTLQHSTPLPSDEILSALQRVRERTQAKGVELRVRYREQWYRWAEITSKEVRRYHPPENCEPLLSIPSLHRGAIQEGSTLLLPLLQLAEDTHGVVLVAHAHPQDASAPRALDLSPLERALSRALPQWLAEKHRKERDQLLAELDRMRALALAEREHLETEVLSQRLEIQRMESQMSELSDGTDLPWIAKSNALRQIDKNLNAWGKTDLPILISGESGVGKDHLARRLWRASARAQRPYLLQNCSALPESLLEAELFGFVRGAFTGAEHDQPGLLRHADGGTLILDHLDEVPLSLQAKLLGFLENGNFRPLGGSTDEHSDLRWIVTLRRDPQAALAAGALRQDLYFRLQGVEIALPPLRERTEEIEPLLDLHLRWHSDKLRVPRPEISPEALQLLLEHSWPGNVRELGNLVQQWLILRMRRITPDDLRLPAPVLPATTPSPAGHSLPAIGTSWKVATQEFQRRYLQSCLEAHEFNQSRTAESLGLSRRHLQNLLDKLDLRDE